MIEQITQYRTLGEVFPTLQKAIDHREAQVELFLRSLPGWQDIPHRKRIEAVQFILDNRVTVRHLLDYDDCAVCEDCDD